LPFEIAWFTHSRFLNLLSMQYRNSLRTFFISLIFLCFACNLFGQTQNQKIEIFTKVWGFLKYHHPAVASGKMDWDSIYVNKLPIIEKTTSDKELNKQLLAIIDNLGPIQKTQPVALPDSLFNINHNLNWITTSKLLNLELKNRLNEIYKYRNQGENKYIKLKYETADYDGEKKYENMQFPDQNYRLLFLARFWNAINYFAPYKYLIGEDWDFVLKRFIPKMLSSNNTITYYKTLLQLAVSLHDGHSLLTITGDDNPITNTVFGKYTAPVFIDIINNTVVVRKLANDTLCLEAGIKKGDIILAIDDEPVTQKMNVLKQYTSTSNDERRDYDLSTSLFNTNNQYQRLKIKRGNQIFTVNVKCILASARYWVDLFNYITDEQGYKSIDNSIAYIYASSIYGANVDKMKALIKSKKAVIFDVRNYPNSDTFYNIFDIFLPKPTAIDIELQILTDNPGYFKWIKIPKIGNINPNTYQGKVIILVDERTQSQGEYSAMALQTIPNSVTIGSQTAGGDGVKTYVPMGGKLTLSYSGYGIYYPDKAQTQRVGVKIDVPVKKTVESVIKNQDLILQEALKYLKEKGID